MEIMVGWRWFRHAIIRLIIIAVAGARRDVVVVITIGIHVVVTLIISFAPVWIIVGLVVVLVLLGDNLVFLLLLLNFSHLSLQPLLDGQLLCLPFLHILPTLPLASFLSFGCHFLIVKLKVTVTVFLNVSKNLFSFIACTNHSFVCFFIFNHNVNCLALCMITLLEPVGCFDIGSELYFFMCTIFNLLLHKVLIKAKIIVREANLHQLFVPI
mmetsp:Transcript_6146/g.7999  ORF Transcript_6146/g.7999 Transcript_6146/m.7999 type:complete len:212 (+) Transcript_6146:1026-1661(+)